MQDVVIALGMFSLQGMSVYIEVNALDTCVGEL